MKSMQYTIRSIPPAVDRALRQRARQNGKSLNEVTIEALEKGTGVSRQPVEHHDLDWLFGTKTLGKEFDDAIAWLDSAPMELD